MNVELLPTAEAQRNAPVLTTCAVEKTLLAERTCAQRACAERSVSLLKKGLPFLKIKRVHPSCMQEGCTLSFYLKDFPRFLADYFFGACVSPELRLLPVRLPERFTPSAAIGSLPEASFGWILFSPGAHFGTAPVPNSITESRGFAIAFFHFFC